MEETMDDLRHILRPVMRCKQAYARQKGGFNWIIIGCLLSCLIFWGLVIAIVSHADTPVVWIDLAKIAQIESSGNTRAWNKVDDSRGLYQITPICLQEWNNYHPAKQYTMDDLWTVSINEEIAGWYLNVRIPQMLRHYKIDDSVENRIWAYNAGIGNVVKGRMPKITQNYLRKYGVR